MSTKKPPTSSVNAMMMMDALVTPLPLLVHAKKASFLLSLLFPIGIIILEHIIVI